MSWSSCYKIIGPNFLPIAVLVGSKVNTMVGVSHSIAVVVCWWDISIDWGRSISRGWSIDWGRGILRSS